LFRPEALEHRERQRGPGDILRVAPGWVGTAFYILVGLFLVALVAGLTLDVERSARGPMALDSRGRVVVLLPAALAPEVAAGSRVEIAGSEADVVAAGEEVLYPPDVREIYGLDVAAPSIAVITSARPASAPEGVARVVMARRPALVALVPGLDALFGGDGG
jgi:hypothetical protein